MDRSLLQVLAEDRLKDAQILLSRRRYSGAYYLAGYSIECGLKACVAKSTRRHEFPDKYRTQDSYTHNLSKLVNLAGLAPLQKARFAADPQFATYWGLVKDWSEESRYSKTKVQTAKAMIEAVSDPASGVLSWLKQHW